MSRHKGPTEEFRYIGLVGIAIKRSNTQDPREKHTQTMEILMINTITHSGCRGEWCGCRHLCVLLAGGTEIGVRNKQDRARAMCPAGPGIQQLPNESSGYCFLLPLGVLLLLCSGPTAKQFAPLREKRPCSERGRGRSLPSHPGRVQRWGREAWVIRKGEARTDSNLLLFGTVQTHFENGFYKNTDRRTLQ